MKKAKKKSAVKARKKPAVKKKLLASPKPKREIPDLVSGMFLVMRDDERFLTSETSPSGEGPFWSLSPLNAEYFCNRADAEEKVSNLPASEIVSRAVPLKSFCSTDYNAGASGDLGYSVSNRSDAKTFKAAVRDTRRNIAYDIRDAQNRIRKALQEIKTCKSSVKYYTALLEKFNKRMKQNYGV